MFELSSLIIEWVSTSVFSALESLDYQAISKDYLGDIQASYNTQIIIVQFFTVNDYESMANKIIDKGNFD